MSEKTNKKNTHNIAVDRFHRMNRLSLRRHFANWIPNSSNILSFKHNSWKYEPHNILCLYLNEADIRASEKISSYSRWVHQICFCSRNFCSLIAEGKTSYKHMFMLYFFSSYIVAKFKITYVYTKRSKVIWRLRQLHRISTLTIRWHKCINSFGTFFDYLSMNFEETDQWCKQKTERKLKEYLSATRNMLLWNYCMQINA